MSVISALDFTDLLLAVWPQQSAKRAAAAAGRSHRTAQDWLQRRSAPDINTALRMARTNADLREAMIKALSGEAYAETISSLGGASGEALRREVASVRGLAGEEVDGATAPTRRGSR